MGHLHWCRPCNFTQWRTCGRPPEMPAYVLNHCHYNLGMVRERHNAILERVVRAVPEFLGTKMKEQPLPGTTGDNSPDLTIISPCGTKVTLVEVSCPLEGSPTALEDAAAHKVTKYEPLRLQMLQNYSEVTIHPFIVGNLGRWFPGNDRVLSALRISHDVMPLRSVHMVPGNLQESPQASHITRVNLITTAHPIAPRDLPTATEPQATPGGQPTANRAACSTR